MIPLSIPERMIVAPAVGVFHSWCRDDGWPGQVVEIGQSIGRIHGRGSTTAVRSPFRGIVAGMLACDGERLREGEPVAWLRITTSES